MLPCILLSGSKGDLCAYEDAVCAAGGKPVSGYCPTVDLNYDGLILCGGDDVDPARFGQEDQGSRDIDPARDQAELDLAEAFLKAGKPILGICRGHQVLNIALGGTLIQDISEDLKPFHTYEKAAPYRKTHPIGIAEDSVLSGFYGPLAQVNSAHHQALGRLGNGLRATAWSEGGLVEGMEHENLPVLGVQFHPEQMCGQKRRPDTADGSFIFRWFLRQCSGK